MRDPRISGINDAVKCSQVDTLPYCTRTVLGHDTINLLPCSKDLDLTYRRARGHSYKVTPPFIHFLKLSDADERNFHTCKPFLAYFADLRRFKPHL